MPHGAIKAKFKHNCHVMLVTLHERPFRLAKDGKYLRFAETACSSKSP